MQSEFWNARYTAKSFAYGKAPNDFLKTHAFKTSENVLCLAEGEGRNAVWIAGQGARVTALDYSEAGLEKARLLASEYGVQIQTVHADLNTYEIEPSAWDTIVCIFGHFEPVLRNRVLDIIHKGVKPGGRVLMEVYSKDQLNFKTGGPADPAMLYTLEILEQAFSGYRAAGIVSVERYISEGEFHLGQSSVIQVEAYK